MNDLNDILGSALADFYKGDKNAFLKVISDGFDEDVMPVSYYFRKYEEMPELEHKALELIEGKTLEIGAGAGSHSLILKERGVEVHAIDISPGAVQVMNERGVDNVRCIDMYDLKDERYDHILLLMNGIGIAGTLENLPNFIKHLLSLLEMGGSILLDSTDLRYLYENEDGSFYLDLNAAYYGELNFQFEYKGKRSESFPWLYVDAGTLERYCEEIACRLSIIYWQDEYHFLAQISRK